MCYLQMKVLLTVHQFFPDFASGTEVLTRSVARDLVRRGHTVQIFSGYPADEALADAERFDEYDYEQIHVHRFKHSYTAMGDQQSLITLDYDNQLAAQHFARIIEAFKPDVIHFFHLNRLGTGLIKAAVQATVPATFTPTDFWAVCPTAQLVLADGRLCAGPSTFAGNCVKHFAETMDNSVIAGAIKWLPTPVVDTVVQLTLAKVMPLYPKRHEVSAMGQRLSSNVHRLNLLQKIFSPNPFMTELLVRYGVHADRILESSYGIDQPASPLHLPVPRHITAGRPVQIGFVGTLAPHKGCHILIEAFKACIAAKEVNAELKIYGSPKHFPDYTQQLMQLAADQPAIAFCGVFPNSEIAEIMEGIDILVVPSLWYENTPLVVYSAQAAGRPVIASNLPGISIVVTHDVNGLLFETGNVDDLAGQLRRAIAEPDLIARLGAACTPPKSTSEYVDELLTVWEPNSQAIAGSHLNQI